MKQHQEEITVEESMFRTLAVRQSTVDLGVLVTEHDHRLIRHQYRSGQTLLTSLPLCVRLCQLQFRRLNRQQPLGMQRQPPRTARASRTMQAPGANASAWTRTGVRATVYVA